ncbi:MAG: adenylate/guanylate cyclase domain-containing protein [Acidobacteriota bacterium]
MHLKFFVEGEERTVALGDRELRFGRSGDNEVVLPDYSVSRRHAAVRPTADGWTVVDLGSTNGVEVNARAIETAVLRPGDVLKIGVFELRVTDSALRGKAATSPSEPASSPASPAAGMAPEPGSRSDPAISNATIVRSLEDLSAEFGLGMDGSLAPDPSRAIRQSKREALDQAYASKVFGFLTRLARLLIATESDETILRHVLDIAFEAFPVDRGFLLLRDDEDRLVCELMRSGDSVEFRPEGEVPISTTMLESVMQERVALLTYDALSDQRLAGTESVRIHQIRAAMCAPLWSGERIIGVMQLDTPHHVGTFTEPDVDLLATLANYCAVAIERNRNARDAEHAREVRNRLQRYHSPSVIEQVMRSDADDDGEHKLTKAEVSVLFADIVGFTAYSELAEPEDVAALMESYFTHAVEAIFGHGGTLDKFIGDCVMAFFGAPMALDDHADRAVSAACDIRAALTRWNGERAAAGLPPVRVRIAINTGPVVVGDIGSNRRVDYTVLGNTVNVAARLEEMVASAGDIVIGEATYDALRRKVEVESLGAFQLKGLQQQIGAYRVS